MQRFNAPLFMAGSNLNPEQIQKLFSPVSNGDYANTLVFAPSPKVNPQEAVVNAIESLRQNPSKHQADNVAQAEPVAAHG